MLSKKMHKLFSDFTLAVKLVFQMCRSHLPNVLQKTCVPVSKYLFRFTVALKLWSTRFYAVAGLWAISHQLRTTCLDKIKMTLKIQMTH